MSKRKAPEASHQDDPFQELPTDILFHLLRFLGLEDVIPLCQASPTYAHLMTDESFSFTLRREAKKRKLDRENARIARAQEQVRSRVEAEFGSSIYVFASVCQQHPEIAQNPEYQKYMESLQTCLQRGASKLQ